MTVLIPVFSLIQRHVWPSMTSIGFSNFQRIPPGQKRFLDKESISFDVAYKPVTCTSICVACSSLSNSSLSFRTSWANNASITKAWIRLCRVCSVCVCACVRALVLLHFRVPLCVSSWRVSFLLILLFSFACRLYTSHMILDKASVCHGWSSYPSTVL
jgi:hypothetical protein